MTGARRGSKFTPVGLALLCSHCALGGLFAILGLFGLAAVPTLFGLSLNWIWPPVAILGGFGLWIWSGRRSEEAACDIR